MTSGELLARFRSELADTVKPYLWTDADIYSYIDDAQKTFCRKTDGISDATTPEVVNVAVTATPATSWIDLHPSILKIRAATRDDTGRDMDVINREDMALHGMRFDGKLGPVRSIIIGEEANKARVYPTSNEAVGLTLLVFRLPLVVVDDDMDLEIAEEHHEGLLLWCKHRGYGKTDADTYDRTKSEEFKTLFLAYCREAMLEERRKRHKPRTVAYGGY